MSDVDSSNDFPLTSYFIIKKYVFGKNSLVLGKIYNSDAYKLLCIQYNVRIRNCTGHTALHQFPCLHSMLQPICYRR
jgi:hypothetical protein